LFCQKTPQPKRLCWQKRLLPHILVSAFSRTAKRLLKVKTCQIRECARAERGRGAIQPGRRKAYPARLQENTDTTTRPEACSFSLSIGVRLSGLPARSTH